MSYPNTQFNREYLLRLPLPIAQLYGRSYNAKTDRERHDNAFYLFEAWIKLAASSCTAYYLEEVTSGSVPRVAMLDRLLAQLAIPSLGQWLAILRELTKHYSTQVNASENPFGKIWHQLTASKRDPSALLALFRRIKNGPDSPPGGDQSCSLLQVLEAIVQYRNAVFGHGAGRFDSFYAQEMGPLLFPALNEMLAAETIAPFGPATSHFAYINDLRVVEDGRTEVGLRALIGTQGERLPPIRLNSEQAESLLPNRVCLIWPGRDVPLRLDPMLVFRESDLTEDILFLNRDRNGKQVEYLSYTTGRTERDRAMQPAMAALLSQVTNRTINEEDLKHLSEQSLTESMSVDSLFAIEPITTQELGEYELLAELGRGGMGVVYLARQASLGRLVALKMLPQDLSSDEVALARFKREIRNLAQCDDPHIIKIISSGIFPDGRPYYTMEYVPGSDLEGVWRELSSSEKGGNATSSTSLGTKTWAEAALAASRKQRDKVAERSRSGSKSADTASASSEPFLTSNLPLPPLPQVPNVVDDPGGYVRWVVTLMRDIARALQTVHDRGIIHRDIKPANLLLTADGTRAVLMDFGLAKDVLSSMAASRQGGLLGTLRYAAPEQLAAANMKIGPTVDVRGLGVTMWELLTRQRVFGASEDEANLTQEVLTSDVPRLRSIDPKFDRDLEAIVARATERRIVDRIQTAGHLADLMQLWLDGKPLPIRPLSTIEKAWRWAREHASLAGTAAAVLLLATIVGALLLQSALDRRRQSEAKWQQFSKQSNRLVESAIPEFSKAIRQVNVPLEKAQMMLDSIERETKASRSFISSERMVGESRTKSEELTQKLEESAAACRIRFEAVGSLVHAQRQRLIVNEESFRSADGLPIIFGRGAFSSYREVMTELSGTPAFQEQDVLVLASKLREHEITEQLRLAIDDWFSLSYVDAERTTREWLAKLANELDAGDEKPRRQWIRDAILAADENVLAENANTFVKSSVTDVEQFYSGLMLSDGLIQSLRLQSAMDVLRHLRKASEKKELDIPLFAVRWANHVLGIVLVTVGSQDQLLEAIQCFEAVSTIDPTFEPVLCGKASAFRLLAKPEKALEYNRAIQSPELQMPKLFMEAYLAADVGKTDEARAKVDELLEKYPESAMAYSYVHGILVGLLEFETAREVARIALEWDPTNPAMIWKAYDKFDPDFQIHMEKVPPERLRRFWESKTFAFSTDLTAAMQSQDVEGVKHARAQLHLLGYQDWSIDLAQFYRLISTLDWNSDWELPFRSLRSTAPSIHAESVPNPLLAALKSQPASLRSDSARNVVLRDIETAPNVYPPSKYYRLQAAANMFRYVDKLMAIRFYEGAIRTIENLRELGYGTDDFWVSEEKGLNEAINTLENPASVEPTDPEGQAQLLRTLKNIGTSQYNSQDYAGAEQTFLRLREFAKSLTEKNEDSIANYSDLALAHGWLSLTKLALGESDAALAFSDQDIELSRSTALRFSEDRELQMNLIRSQEFRMQILVRPDQNEERLQVTMKALDLLSAYLKKWPDDGTAIHKLILDYAAAGEIHFDRKQFEEAKKFFELVLPTAERRLQAAPNNTKTANDVIILQMNLGRTALGLENLVDATDHFKKALENSRAYAEKHQEDPVFLRLLANSLSWSSIISASHGQAEEMLEYLKQEIAVHKRLRDFGETDETELLIAISSRIQELKRFGRFDEALKELNDDIRRMDKQPELLHLRGQIHYEKSEIQPAIDDLTQAISMDDQNPHYLSSRAEVYTWNENNELAEKDYTRAIELEPTSEVNWLSRAKSRAFQGRLQEAVKDFDRWLEFSPTQFEPLNIAGVTYFRTGNIARAIEVFQKAIESEPQSGLSNRNRPKAYAFEKNWKLASEH